MINIVLYVMQSFNLNAHCANTIVVAGLGFLLGQYDDCTIFTEPKARWILKLNHRVDKKTQQ